MKYELETIPIWDAYDMETECPLCVLGDRAEKRYIDFFLGSSVMAPEMRVEVNKTGFCRKHFQELFSSEKNRHGLGLLSHTHVKEFITPLFKKQRNLSALSKVKTSPRLKKSTHAYNKFLQEHEKACLICDRLDYTLKRYAFTIVYLWQTDPKFEEKFGESKGFCLYHSPYVLDMAAEVIGGGKYSSFINQVLSLQEKSFKRLEKEILWYTQKFDYQNNDKPWGTSKDALNRILQKLTGVVMHDRDSRK